MASVLEIQVTLLRNRQIFSTWLHWRCSLLTALVIGCLATGNGMAQVTEDQAEESTPPSETIDSTPSELLDIPQEVIDDSLILQEWLEKVPDIAEEIVHEPSFPTRVRAGYTQFPSMSQAGGFQIGIEDLFVIQGSSLTISGDYSRSWNGQQQSYGAEARYYLLPLGEYFNLAPMVGYRNLNTPKYASEGVNVGFRVLLIPSRGGGADISISQSWVAPGSQEEVGITALSISYGISRHLRVATDVQFQNSSFGQDSQVGVLLEYLP